jgi:hypothetical protein
MQRGRVRSIPARCGQKRWERSSLGPTPRVARIVRDSLPLIGSPSEISRASGRQAPSRCHFRPTFEHQGWICPHYRLHWGSDSAPRVLGRLLLLSQGPINVSLPVDEEPECARGQRQTWCSSRAHLVVKAMKLP